MQIMLVQTEIEEAIRNLVTSQVQVRDGMRIDIDLSATRGADGFKATINIVPENSPAGQAERQAPEPEASVKAVEEPVIAKATTAPAKVTRVAKAATPAKAIEPEAEKALEAEPELTVEAKGDDTANTAENGQGGTASSDQASEAAPAATAGKSLFANLQRPQNA